MSYSLIKALKDSLNRELELVGFIRKMLAESLPQDAVEEIIEEIGYGLTHAGILQDLAFYREKLLEGCVRAESKSTQKKE